MGRESQSLGVARSGHGDGDAILLPQLVICALGRHIANLELHDAGRESRFDVRLHPNVGSCASCVLRVSRQRSHPRLRPGRPRSGCRNRPPLRGDHARIVALTEDLELAGAFQFVSPPRRDDRRPDAARFARRGRRGAGLERPHHPLVGAGRVGIAPISRRLTSSTPNVCAPSSASSAAPVRQLPDLAGRNRCRSCW